MIEEKRTDESNPSQYLRRTLSNSNKDLCIILCLLDEQSSNRLISIQDYLRISLIFYKIPWIFYEYSCISMWSYMNSYEFLLKSYDIPWYSLERQTISLWLPMITHEITRDSLWISLNTIEFLSRHHDIYSILLNTLIIY